MDLLVAALFGVGGPVAWSIAFARFILRFRRHRDRRAMREVLAVSALWVASLAAGVTVYFAVTQDAAQDLRRLMAGVAWGMFLGAGVVFALDLPPDDQ